MAVKVKNINGSADITCTSVTWLEQWENFSGQALPKLCPEERCILRPEVGALVQKDGACDGEWYIIPLCKLHSAEKGASLVVSDIVKLVPANSCESCVSDV